MIGVGRIFGSLAAFAVLTTACGASGDSSGSVGTTGLGETAPADFVVSPDGLLAVAKPADGAEITIDVVKPEPGDGLVVPVGVYELGPTGSTFDPPLAAHIMLTEQAMDQGVLILHKTDEGVIESVDVAFDATGASFEIDGFSEWIINTLGPYTIELQGPSQGFVNEVVNVDLSIQSGDSVFPVEGTSVLSNRSDFIVEAPLARDGANIICASEGFGLVRYDGNVTIDLDAVGYSSSWSTRSDQVVVSSHGVDCVRRITIEPDDFRCVFRSTGEDAEGCPEDVQVGLSVNDSGTLDMSMNFVDRIIVTWSFSLQTDEEFLLQETSETGEYNAWYGAGLEGFTPGEPPGFTVARAGETVFFMDFPIDLGSQEALQVAAPAGETEGGQQVAAGSMSLVDLTVFTSEETPDGEVQGTYTFFPEHVAEAIASMLLEISGAGG